MKMQGDNEVLIIRFSALGDVAMTIPVVYSLAKQHPSCRFLFVTRPFFCGLFVNRPENLEVTGIDFNGEYRGVYGMLKLLRFLNGLRISAVADLHNVLRSWIIDLFFIVKGRRVVMVDKQRLKKFPHKSIIMRHKYVFGKLGLSMSLSFKSLFEMEEARCPLSLDGTLVGIAPFARYDNKVYDLNMMETVIEVLTSQGINVLLFGGGKRETEIMDKWTRKYSLCKSLSGKYEIETELAIMSRLALMVSMDSANQHLASLVATRVLTIWGGTAPECGFMPYGQSINDSLYANMACQPCCRAGKDKCRLGDKRCMKEITPLMIVGKVKQMLVES
ncbi:MAG: glycosyltransferase family 9 protein [Prevotella sp.]